MKICQKTQCKDTYDTFTIKSDRKSIYFNIKANNTTLFRPNKNMLRCMLIRRKHHIYISIVTNINIDKQIITYLFTHFIVVFGVNNVM